MGPGNAAAKAADEMFEGKMRSASEIRSVNFRQNCSRYYGNRFLASQVAEFITTKWRKP